MKLHHIFIGLVILVALSVTFGVSLFVRAYEPSAMPKFINNSNPRILTVSWNKATESYSIVSNINNEAAAISGLLDLNYNFNLSNGNLIIGRDHETIWQSPADWWVSGYALADVNHDGKTELNLSVWKPGDFGTSKPAWVTENDLSVKNHLFVYELTADGIKALWQSSNLDQPICEFIFADLDGDNKQELGVIEGEYTTDRSCRGKFLAIWKWNEWGFYNQWRSNEGHFSNLKAVEENSDKYLRANLNIP